MNPQKRKRRSDRRARRHIGLAWKAVERGDLQVARREVERAIAERENNPAVWTESGLVHRRLGDQRAAERAFRSAILVAPTYVDAYVHLAAVLADRGRTLQAAKYQRRALELRPDVDSYRRRLAEYEAAAAVETEDEEDL